MPYDTRSYIKPCVNVPIIISSIFQKLRNYFASIAVSAMEEGRVRPISLRASELT